MTLFIITICIILIMEIGARLAYINKDEYPRKSEIDKYVDCGVIFANACFITWGLFIIL